MYLKKATLLAIIGISYTFILRTIGIFFPNIFRDPLIIQISVIISLLASLSIVLFFIAFYKYYIQEKQIRLKKVCILAIIGSFGMVLLQVKNILLVFNKLSTHLYNFSPYLVKLVNSHSIDPIMPWISSIFTLIFFIIFYKETLKDKKIRDQDNNISSIRDNGLNKAILFAIIGSSIGTLLRTFVLINYLYLRESRWFSDLSKETQVILIPIFAFSFITVLYFFLSFYSLKTNEFVELQ